LGGFRGSVSILSEICPADDVEEEFSPVVDCSKGFLFMVLTTSVLLLFPRSAGANSACRARNGFIPAKLIHTILLPRPRRLQT